MPRKTHESMIVTVDIDGASMRPRPDAAENRLTEAERAEWKHPASMRPRPDAAENYATALPSGGGAPGFNEAAARCRGKRQEAAHHSPLQTERFNEAAARCRGKPARGRVTDAMICASMRPRPDAAENTRRRTPSGIRSSSFNEAAARCRGKRCRTAPCRCRRPRFNEAAARCRGKQRAVRPAAALPCEASMRPRPDAAENRRSAQRAGEGVTAASMRPRPDAAENAIAIPACDAVGVLQ